MQIFKAFDDLSMPVSDQKPIGAICRLGFAVSGAVCHRKRAAGERKYR